MSNKESSENAVPDCYESKASAGDIIDLERIGFPVINYRNKDYYGYKKSGIYYHLDTIIVDDKEEYIFQIDQTGKYMNTSQGIPAGGVILNPVYVPFSSSSDVVGESTAPGVRFTYNYNKSDGSLANPEVVNIDFTPQQIRSGVTMDELGLTPTKLNLRSKWNRYDKQQGGVYKDCLFFGYVDPNDHNKAYYYAESVTDPNDKSGSTIVRTHFRYKDLDTGKIFTESDKLDVTKVSHIVPDYIPAGYRPIQDSFGVCRYNNENVNLNLDMVYIPGSYNSPWPYEQALVSSGYTVFNPNSSDWGNAYGDFMTSGNSHQTTDILVADVITTRDFLYKLLYCKGDLVSVLDNVVNVNDSGVVTSYTFSSNKLFSIDSSSLGGGLANYTIPNIAWSYVTYADAIVMSNLLTHLYNIANPSKPLTYVYYLTDNILTNSDTIHYQQHQKLLTDVNDVTNYANFRYFSVRQDGTGYRLPNNYEFSYFAKLITDERQVPSISSIPSSVTNATQPLILSKDFTGCKYYFHSAKDFDYQNSPWFGDIAGLALYNYDSGTYEPILRHSYQGAGRETVDTKYDNPNYPQKAGFIWNDTSIGDDIEDDYNTRNGCGLYNLNGHRFQYIFDTSYGDSISTTYRMARGVSFRDKVTADMARLSYVYGRLASNESNSDPAFSVRFCRSLSF